MRNLYTASTHNVYVRNIDFCASHTQNLILCLLHTQNLYFCSYIDRICIIWARCVQVRSRRGFFPSKIHFLYFINREPLFLCLKYIKHVLSKLGASKCAPAGAFFPPKMHLLYFIYTESLFLCLRYITYVLFKLGATKCAPAGAFSHQKQTFYILYVESLCFCVWNT